MTTASRHDAWQAARSYETYMGRWSRPIAERFVAWLDLPRGLDWLEVGCGTGALTEAIVGSGAPAHVVGIDPSEAFVSGARERVRDPRVEFRVGNAGSLGAWRASSHDAVVSGLVLNFVPGPVATLREMARIARPGGTVAFYVWDYPGGGVEFIQAFWTAAAVLDPGAAELSEARRFDFCTRAGLGELARQAGLAHVDSAAIEAPTVFRDFDDLWSPFTLGTGPAPGYCASLDPDARERLRVAVSDVMPRQPDGSIALRSRAWAFRARKD